MASGQNRRGYCPECDEEFDADLETCPNDGAKLYHFRSSKDADDELVGTTLDGRFGLERVLGEGGMGKVYLGEQLSVGRPVAVKVMRESLVDDELIVKRFFREARVISGFTHPNIVKLIDFGQDDERGLLYLVMELIDGFDLSELLAKGRLSVPLCIEVGKQVCAGLSEPHADDIVHRDLKPENLFVAVTSDGSVQIKILDFGIAHALQVGEERLTGTNMICGTAHYMAPEQARSAQIGPATDIYSLGVLLYEALCGHLPFDADTAIKLMVSHVQVEPPPLREVYPGDDLPHELSDLVHSMLAKDPDQRPDSVLAVRDALEDIERAQGYQRVRIEGQGEIDEMFGPWLGRAAPRRSETSSDSFIPGTDAMATADTGAGDIADIVEGIENDDERAYALAQTLGGSVPNKLEPQSTTRSKGDQSDSGQPVPQPSSSGTAPGEPGMNTMVEQSTDHRTAWILVGLVVAILLAGGVAVVLAVDGDEAPAGAAVDQKASADESTETSGQPGAEQEGTAAVEDEPTQPASEDEPAKVAVPDPEPATNEGAEQASDKESAADEVEPPSKPERRAAEESKPPSRPKAPEKQEAPEAADESGAPEASSEPEAPEEEEEADDDGSLELYPME